MLLPAAPTSVRSDKVLASRRRPLASRGGRAMLSLDHISQPTFGWCSRRLRRRSTTLGARPTHRGSFAIARRRLLRSMARVDMTRIESPLKRSAQRLACGVCNDELRPKCGPVRAVADLTTEPRRRDDLQLHSEFVFEQQFHGAPRLRRVLRPGHDISFACDEPPPCLMHVMSLGSRDSSHGAPHVLCSIKGTDHRRAIGVEIYLSQT